MITPRLPVLAGSALCAWALLSGSANAAIPGDGDLTTFLPAGEFMVANGESKGIAHSDTQKHYRVCVTNEDVNVPLKVTHDGQETMIDPGDCADLEAMRLRVSPGGRLPDDFVMIGRIHHLG